MTPARSVPGLCGDCQFVRVVDSNRGSRFYMCEKSREDSRFNKYPRLPVMNCGGFVRLTVPGDAAR